MTFAAQPTFIQADASVLPFADQSVDLTFFSPPYCDARTYGIGAQRGCIEWVKWMLGVLGECQRVTKGPVVVVAAGVTRDRNYWPACEGLMWEWWKLGGECQLYRPCYWHRVGIPGSGGKDWFRADVEYVMCFKRPGELVWSDNTATGHPPKWGPGGEMSQRLSSGSRVNQWGKVGSKKGMGAKNADGSLKPTGRPSHVLVAGEVSKDFAASYWANPEQMEAAIDREGMLDAAFQPGGNGGYRADGSAKPRYFNGRSQLTKEEKISLGGKPSTKRDAAAQSDGEPMREQIYLPPAKANPGNLLKIIVGGGKMGHDLCHENEAPFPEKLAEHFILSLCPPRGIVLDVCSGSGTTAIVAAKNDRIGIGSDIRFNQCELGAKRAKQTTELHQGKLFGVPA